MKVNKLKGILFDFDGVLAKTMEDNFNAWKMAMKDYGVKIKADDYYVLEGMPLIAIAKKFCGLYNLDESLANDIVKMKEHCYLRNHKFEFYPGVKEFIDLLKSKKIRIGLITAALYPRLKKSVPLHFLKKFDAIVSGEKTNRGKPFPDPYIKGLFELNLKKNECIAIENAPLGIKSAKNAGIYCIAICSTLDKSYLSEADEIVDDFTQLGKRLNKYIY